MPDVTDVLSGKAPSDYRCVGALFSACVRGLMTETRVSFKMVPGFICNSSYLLERNTMKEEAAAQNCKFLSINAAKLDV